MKIYLLSAVILSVCVYAIVAQGNDPIKPKASLIENSSEISNRYFIFLLAHQDEENTIAMSHTFATFVKTEDTNGVSRVVDTCTINWLPVSGNISITRPEEPGVNRSLSETLDWAKQRNLDVTMRGPYEIDEAFHLRAVAQADRLERGEYKYRCYNTNSRNTAKNCIHAVADIFEDERRVDTGTSRGLEATLKVEEYFLPRFKSTDVSETTVSSLVAAVNLYEVWDNSSITTTAGE